MAVNKVVYNTENGAETLIDLTGDSVTPETLAEGTTAHDASGEEITGTMATTSVLYTEQSLTDDQKTQARENIGALAESELQNGINNALAQAKASGEFDGEDGAPLTVEMIEESNIEGEDTVLTLSDGTVVKIKNGKNGEDGTSVSITGIDMGIGDGAENKVYFSTGHTLSVFNGNTGAQGEKGADGSNGKDGTSVTITKIETSDVDGGSNIVYFSNGQPLVVQNGSKGSTGDKGEQGIQGERGLQGEQGIQGIQGEKGDTGANGTDGVGIKSVVQTTTSSDDGGSNVITVTKTDNSTSTFTVKNGSKGSKGDKGDKGDTGATGSTGANGKSAYTYAQEGGYTGTEAQFASDLSQISNRADKDYLISVFEELKTAIAESNIDAAVAVLDKAILDLSALS